MGLKYNNLQLNLRLTTEPQIAPNIMNVEIL